MPLTSTKKVKVDHTCFFNVCTIVKERMFVLMLEYVLFKKYICKYKNKVVKKIT